MSKVKTYNHLTGEEEIREMNAEELAEYNEMVEEIATKKAKEKIERQEAEAALLDSLGITKQQAIILGLLQPDYVRPNLGQAQSPKKVS